MAGKDDILASMRLSQPVSPVDNSMAGAPATARVAVSTLAPGSSSAHGQVNVNDAGANKEAGLSGTPVSGDDANFEMRKQEALAGYDRVKKILEDRMKGYEPEDEAIRQRRERRERSRRLVTAVGDGLSALSNLIFTTKYAPDSYRHEKSQSAALEAHYDKMKAEREAAADKYMNFALKLGDVENQRAATLRDLEDWRDRQRKAKDAADRDNKRFSWEEEERPEIMRKRQADADYSENRARKSGAEADIAPELAAEKLASQKAQTNQRGAAAAASRAAASASYARGEYYKNGGSSGSKKHHFLGKEYKSEKDYTKDVTEAARAYNLRHKNDPDFAPIVIEDEEETAHGSRRKPRRPEEYAGEVERRLAEEKTNDDFSQYELGNTEDFSQYEKKR